MSVDKMSVKTKTKFQKLLAKIAGYEESVEPKTKEQKLLNEIAESGGSSGGGGANVLTLYLGEKDGMPWAYKDEEHTEEYATAEEAENALNNAIIIKCVTEYDVAFASKIIASGGVYVTIVEVNSVSGTLNLAQYALYEPSGGNK